MLRLRMRTASAGDLDDFIAANKYKLSTKTKPNWNAMRNSHLQSGTKITAAPWTR